MKKLVTALFLIFSFSLFAQEKERMVLIETNLGNMKVKLYNDTPKHRDNFIRLAREGHYDGTLFYRVIKDFVIQGGSSDSRGAIAGQSIGFGKPMTIDAEIKEVHYHKKGALAAPRQPNRENFYKESDISQFYIVQGRKYTEKELEMIEKSVNIPIKNAIRRKYYTPEKKVILDSLRALKKVDEFRRIAGKIKENIEFDWNTNTDKIYMPEDKKEAYMNSGGMHHLDKEYTVFGEVVEGLEVIDKIAALPTDENNRPFKDVKIKVKVLN
ncbi:peptidylprolyl isomerase [Culturomica massiliensis]|jgi:cyclophilin family peptidyl-prolyl cis-trans isomerase|uniref:peptidylprolyl isomerase n=1 Tax=Culturomica massiliensis TaxID=1841857 RepID=UPI0009F1C22C|nr:peptidylprolyl isomerase [Culturomica massiliensis]